MVWPLRNTKDNDTKILLRLFQEEVLKFYTSVSESACKLLVEGLICELLLRMGINNVRGTSPCSVNEEPRILSGLLKF